MVLPGFLVSPLWILIAIIFPVVQSIHSLQTKSDNRKVWLFYWINYVVFSLILHHFEWVIYIPFAILDMVFMRLYYEVQLLFMVFWVVPRFFGVKMVFGNLFSDKGAEIMAAHFKKFKGLASEHGQSAYEAGLAKYAAMNEAKATPAPPAQKKKGK